MVHSHIPIAQKKFDGHATTRHSTKYLKASFMHLNTYTHSFSSHSPWRRCKDQKILHNFWHSRGTKIDGSWKCRMGAFCTIATNLGEMSKKGLKTGKNGVKFFFRPHTSWLIAFVTFFYFQYFSFWCFTDPLF